MRIYALTPLGKKLARNTNNPDTAEWKVVHALDFRGYGTADQIASDANLDYNETAMALNKLKRSVNGNGQSIVTEVSHGQQQNQGGG